jgi:hypothetical protein
MTKIKNFHYGSNQTSNSEPDFGHLLSDKWCLQDIPRPSHTSCHRREWFCLLCLSQSDVYRQCCGMSRTTSSVCRNPCAVSRCRGSLPFLVTLERNHLRSLFTFGKQERYRKMSPILGNVKVHTWLDILFEFNFLQWIRSFSARRFAKVHSQRYTKESESNFSCKYSIPFENTTECQLIAVFQHQVRNSRLKWPKAHHVTYRVHYPYIFSHIGPPI